MPVGILGRAARIQDRRQRAGECVSLFERLGRVYQDVLAGRRQVGVMGLLALCLFGLRQLLAVLVLRSFEEPRVGRRVAGIVGVLVGRRVSPRRVAGELAVPFRRVGVAPARKE